MSIMERLFGKPPAVNVTVAGPVNPNLNHDPNDPSLSQQQRQAAIQAQGAQPRGATNAPAPTAGAMNNAAPGENLGNTQTSPLDQFEKIWETPAIDPKQKPRGFVYPKFDNAKLSERVNQMNFAGAIPDDMISKAMSDPAAFREVLNAVGRQGFQSAFTANNNLNSQLFSQFDESINERIPAQVKGIQNQAAVFSEMKNLSHPAVAPLLSKVAEQIQMQYPDATSEEIKEKAKIYMGTMAKLITGQIDGETAENNRSDAGSRRTGSKVIQDFSSFET